MKLLSQNLTFLYSDKYRTAKQFTIRTDNEDYVLNRYSLHNFETIIFATPYNKPIRPCLRATLDIELLIEGLGEN